MIERIGFGLVFRLGIHANQDRYLPLAAAAILDATWRPRLPLYGPARPKCGKSLSTSVAFGECVKRSIVPNRIAETVTLNRFAQLADVVQLCVSRSEEHTSELQSP